MQVRIVMEQDLSLNGKLTIKYVPQYKGWFFWKNFESGCDVDTYDTASFNTFEKAQAFLNEYARMKGLHKSTVITEYIIEQWYSSCLYLLLGVHYESGKTIRTNCQASPY